MRLPFLHFLQSDYLPDMLRPLLLEGVEQDVARDFEAFRRSGFTSGQFDVDQYAAKVRGTYAPSKLLKERVSSAFEIIPFFADRLKVQQREAGVRHDLIDAVFALGGEDDLVRLLARVRALQAFVETPEGADLLAGYKRAANILKKEGWGPPIGTESQEAADSARMVQNENKTLSYRPEKEEAELIAALDSAEPRARAAVEAEDFEGAMAALASLRAPVDSFFDKVTVNDPDPAKREARLDLLARMRDAVHRVADFSKIEG
jgi:glycyl-tRNA synthetase beta chain